MRSRSILSSAVFAALVATTTAACLERPIKPQDARSTAFVLEPLKLSAVERIDLLLAIDNSASMGDKQEILARAVPDLVKRLANPRCVDIGNHPAPKQPESPTAPCPLGTDREFFAVPDIHIGIVSSSLGGGAKGVCATDKDNDRGHLLSRTPDGSAEPTYENHGFLAWDPDKKLTPAGESVLDGGNTGLVPSLQDMVRGVGENGCGFEGQLESWYRFLIDPAPSEALVQQGNDLVPSAKVDKTVLDQRKQFLRPDSLVAIVMLSDENDCSIAPGEGAADVFNNVEGFRMVRPRSECAETPDAACCTPCGEAPAECKADAACLDESGNIAHLTATEDPVNLRCFDQKRRFGKSYLHPLDRYVKGLNDLQIDAGNGEMTANPLFMDLNPDDDIHGTRNPELVFLTGIVGVPWQDIARDPSNLARGLKGADDLAARDAQGKSVWDVILGDPAKGIEPLDKHMVEQTKPRTGTNPVTGTDLAPVDAAAMADPIVGHEAPEKDNPQFACIFPLLAPIAGGDDCKKPDGNPLCQDAAGNYSTTQLYGKAFPGTRELGVLKGVGAQAIVASVCPANMDESTEAEADDFGYRPAIGALVDRLKDKLGHQCLPRKLTPDANDQVSCLVLEARKSESCSCNAVDGRTRVEDAHVAAVQGARDSGIIDDSNDCFCEIPQLEGAELSACQNEKADPLVIDGDQADGWCYIDASSIPKVGSPALVPESCASTERRLVRFVGNGKARPGSTLFIMCSEG